MTATHRRTRRSAASREPSAAMRLRKRSISARLFRNRDGATIHLCPGCGVARRGAADLDGRHRGLLAVSLPEHGRDACDAVLSRRALGAPDGSLRARVLRVRARRNRCASIAVIQQDRIDPTGGGPRVDRSPRGRRLDRAGLASTRCSGRRSSASHTSDEVRAPGVSRS